MFHGIQSFRFCPQSINNLMGCRDGLWSGPFQWSEKERCGIVEVRSALARESFSLPQMG